MRKPELAKNYKPQNLPPGFFLLGLDGGGVAQVHVHHVGSICVGDDGVLAVQVGINETHRTSVAWDEVNELILQALSDYVQFQSKTSYATWRAINREDKEAAEKAAEEKGVTGK